MDDPSSVLQVVLQDWDEDDEECQVSILGDLRLLDLLIAALQQYKTSEWRPHYMN